MNYTKSCRSVFVPLTCYDTYNIDGFFVVCTYIVSMLYRKRYRIPKKGAALSCLAQFFLDWLTLMKLAG